MGLGVDIFGLFFSDAHMLLRFECAMLLRFECAQADVCDHLVPSWWCCFTQNSSEIKPCWRNEVLGDGP